MHYAFYCNWEYDFDSFTGDEIADRFDTIISGDLQKLIDRAMKGDIPFYFKHVLEKAGYEPLEIYSDRFIHAIYGNVFKRWFKDEFGSAHVIRMKFTYIDGVLSLWCMERRPKED